MARRGVFGRQPRPAPSLTSTLVSIAHQMQSQEDQNIMDAWKNGGMFEGAPATDERVLQYWKNRVSTVSKDDPLYDTYQNAVTQYEYTIAESKQSTLYKQGKISDTAMASFYSNWARKIPQDTEFYRVLQRDAAQFIQSAKAKSASAAATAKEAAYVKFQNDTYNKSEAGPQYMSDVLSNLMSAGHVSANWSDISGGNSLTNMTPTTPDTIQQLVYLVNGAGTASFNDTVAGISRGNEVLYHDENGKPVTAHDIMTKLKTLSPGLFNANGQLSIPLINKALDQQSQSVQKRIANAKATGHISDANALQSNLDKLTATRLSIRAIPVESAYNHALQTFNAAINAPNATPDDKTAAWNTYHSTLIGLASDPSLAQNDALRVRLVAEANGDEKSLPLSADFGGTPSSNATVVADRNVMIENWANHSAAVHDPQSGYIWTHGVTDAQGNFTAKVGGTAVGAASMQQIAGLGPEPQSIFQVGPDGHSGVQITDPGIAVTVTAYDANGNSIPSTDRNPIAYFHWVMKDGIPQKLYTWTNPSGGPAVSSLTPPWDQSTVVVSPDGTNLRVTYNGTPDNPLAAPGFSTKTASGKTTLQFSAFDATIGANKTKVAADGQGIDPHTDAYDPTLAAHMGSPAAQAELAAMWSSTPGLRDSVMATAHTLAGDTSTTDPKTGQVSWIANPGNPYGFNQQMGKIATANDLGAAGSIFKTTSGIQNLLGNVQDLWNKNLTPAPSPTLSGNFAGTAMNILGSAMTGPARQPIDLLGGTPLAALGQASPNIDVNASGYGKLDSSWMGGTMVKPPTSLTLPAIPNAPNPLAPPTPPSTPSVIPGTLASQIAPTAQQETYATGTGRGGRIPL